MSEYKAEAMEKLGLKEDDILDFKEYPGNKIVFVTHDGLKKEIKLAGLSKPDAKADAEIAFKEDSAKAADAKADAEIAFKEDSAKAAKDKDKDKNKKKS